jgi:hypothetical protein
VIRGVVLAGLFVTVVGACAQRGGGAPTRETVPNTVLERGSGAGSGDTADRAGPAGFPVPRDAETVEDTPPDHTFKVPRRLAEVIGELKVNLAQMGFKIVDEYVEDAQHTHWYITRDAVTYKVTVAGDAADHTLIILTIE